MNPLKLFYHGGDSKQCKNDPNCLVCIIKTEIAIVKRCLANT